MHTNAPQLWLKYCWRSACKNIISGSVKWSVIFLLFGVSLVGSQLKLLKLLMIRLSEFSFHGLVHVMNWIWCILFVVCCFSLTIFCSETNIQCPPVFMGNNWTSFGHDGSLLILSLRATSVSAVGIGEVEISRIIDLSILHWRRSF